MTVTVATGSKDNQPEDYNKVIAEQLTRIADILTGAFQGQIMQYNQAVRLSNEVEQLKSAYGKLTMAYNDLKTHNADLMTIVEQKEKEDANSDN